MKLKTVEVNGATYAEIKDGRPLYVDDAGKEFSYDAEHSTATINRLNTEARVNREKLEAAETKLKPFEGIEDAEAAMKALATVRNLTAGDLVKADKVEEIKREARLAAEKQVADAARASGEEMKRLNGEREALQNQLYAEKVGGAFSRSKFNEKLWDAQAGPDMMKALFGQRFKVEEGKIVGYDASGNKIYSRGRPGEIADFDEALETIVDSYPHRDSILKGTNQSGSGGRHANGGGGGTGGKKEISRADFNKLLPAEQMKAMTVDRMSVVD